MAKPKIEKKDKIVNAIDEIIDGIYLGGILAYNKVKEYNITAILNCAKELQYESYAKEEFGIKEYKHIKIDDLESENISDFIEEGVNFITNQNKNKIKILVHCFEGKSRSSTFIIAYLMLKYKWDLKKSYNFVKKKRTIIQPNRTFFKELIKIEKKLYNKNTMNEKDIKGVKWFECPMCNNQKFLKKDRLDIHVNRKHKDLLSKAKNEDDTKQNSK